MFFGASYYHEYQPYERLEEDIRLMREAGVSCVRVGESTWASWEPEPGRFELAWMDRILDALYAADIKVILGTPTYAIPPWLHTRHPEVMAELPSGRAVPYGARQNIDFTHPTYRFHAERLIRTLLQHFAAHPAIVGYQLDNETGSGLLFNSGVFEQFVAFLQAKYGEVTRLNEVWGLTYWSQRLRNWEELWRPEGNTNPGYNLAWRRFQAQLVTDFLAWQAGIVREYARPEQFLTQDLVGGHGRPEGDRRQIAKIMDIVGENPYHLTQDGLLFPAREAPVLAAPPWTGLRVAGPWLVWESADLGWSGQQRNFLVLEYNALSIGGSADNYPSYDGQWRLAAYAMIARGANSVLYWHWHTLHYGNETYWHGLLNHDLEPNRCFHELSRLGLELRRYDMILTDLIPDAQVAFLYSQESKYALEFHPCLTRPGQQQADESSYQRIFDTFYRAFFEARAQSVIVHPDQAFEHLPVLVVPALLIADDTLLERLVCYAEQGGHLLLTFRSGYMDEEARARWRRAPGILRACVGASYQEYANLTAPLPVQATNAFCALPPEARATAWVDGLEVEGATPLVFYEHPHFGRFPAVVSQQYGKGRVTYVGTLPDPLLGKALAQWVCQQAGVPLIGEVLPEAVRVTTAQAQSGERLWFFSNCSWETQTLSCLPIQGRSLFSEAPVSEATPLHLEPWDVQIVVEE